MTSKFPAADSRVHFGSTIAEYNKLSVLECSECGIKHLSPIPDTTIYERGTFYKAVKPDYVDEYSLDAKWWEAVYSDWIELIKPFLPNPHLLDVGSGTGQFLDACSRANLIQIGLEPDHSMASRRNDIVWCEYGDYIHKGFGCVSAHWVIEHLSDPAHFLDWARNRLVDGGVLLITIPNDFSSIQLEAMALVNRPYYWLHRTHVNYWNAGDFRAYLKLNGFDVRHIYGSWQPERYLLDGMNYLDDHALGRQLHQRRKENDLEVSQQYRLSKYLLLGEQGLGRDLTFVVTKR